MPTSATTGASDSPLKKKPTAIGVFDRWGGWTIGMKEAGFDIKGLVPNNPKSRQCLHANHPDIMLTYKENAPHYRDIDVIYCAPPCAPYSQASNPQGGKQRLSKDHPKVAYAYDALEVGLAILPKIWVLESVEGLYENSRDIIDEFANKWKALGYEIVHFLTNGVLHGLPQYRARYHLIATKVDLKFTLTKQAQITVRDAIGHLPPDTEAQPLKPHIQEILKYTEPGGSLLNVWKKITAAAPGNPGPSIGLRRLAWDRPCWVIAGFSFYIHPEEPRLLTPLETKALMGYPDDYLLPPGKIEKHLAATLLGQGIMPPVGRYLAQVFYRALEKGYPAESTDYEEHESLVDFRGYVRHIPKDVVKLDPELWGSRPDLIAPFASKKVARAASRIAEYSEGIDESMDEDIDEEDEDATDSED